MARQNKKPKPVLISPEARDDIAAVLRYLESPWSEKAVNHFLERLTSFYRLIALQPRLFSYYNKRKNIRKFALTKHHLIFYRNTKAAVEIITLLDGRQNPTTIRKKLKR